MLYFKPVTKFLAFTQLTQKKLAAFKKMATPAKTVAFIGQHQDEFSLLNGLEFKGAPRGWNMSSS